MQLIEVYNLNQARLVIKEIKTDIVITNPKYSTKYLGVLVIDYIFRTLKSEFSVIKSCVLNTSDDASAVYVAKKLGYKNNEL